jgi:hypothetical protein
MGRRSNYLLRRPFFYDLAVMHHRNPMAELFGNSEVMGNEQQGQLSLILQCLEQSKNLPSDQDVQRRSGLIEQQHIGLGDQRAGDCNALRLTAGELAGQAVGEIRGKIHFPQCLFDKRGSIGCREVCAQMAQWFGDYVRNAPLWIETGGRILKHWLDAAAMAVCHLFATGERFAAPVNGAAVDRTEPGNRAAERRFAGSRAADQGKGFAGGNGEGRATHGIHAAIAKTGTREGDADIARFEQRVAGLRECRRRVA